MALYIGTPAGKTAKVTAVYVGDGKKTKRVTGVYVGEGGKTRTVHRT